MTPAAVPVSWIESKQPLPLNIPDSTFRLGGLEPGEHAQPPSPSALGVRTLNVGPTLCNIEQIVCSLAIGLAKCKMDSLFFL